MPVPNTPHNCALSDALDGQIAACMAVLSCVTGCSATHLSGSALLMVLPWYAVPASCVGCFAQAPTTSCCSTGSRWRCSALCSAPPPAVCRCTVSRGNTSARTALQQRLPQRCKEHRVVTSERLIHGLIRPATPGLRGWLAGAAPSPCAMRRLKRRSDMASGAPSVHIVLRPYVEPHSGDMVTGHLLETPFLSVAQGQQPSRQCRQRGPDQGGVLRLDSPIRGTQVRRPAGVRRAVRGDFPAFPATQLILKVHVFVAAITSFVYELTNQLAHENSW